MNIFNTIHPPPLWRKTPPRTASLILAGPLHIVALETTHPHPVPGREFGCSSMPARLTVTAHTDFRSPEQGRSTTPVRWVRGEREYRGGETGLGMGIPRRRDTKATRRGI